MASLPFSIFNLQQVWMLTKPSEEVSDQTAISKSASSPLLSDVLMHQCGSGSVSK
jgi:hypothetical protein